MNRMRVLGLALITASLGISLGCQPGASQETEVESPPSSALAGLWQGFGYLEGQEIRVEIEVQQDSAGNLTAEADFRDSGSLDNPLQVDLTDRTVTFCAGSGPLFEGQLQDNLRAIEGQLFAATTGTWYSLVLEKDNDAFRRFSVPRLTEEGAVQRRYSYRPPEGLEGGWPVSTLAAERIDEGQIAGLIESVFREEHGHPEAILIARDGKLVLEEYFYGYSRDRIHPIQSVTKSVVSLLFGIARERGFVGALDEPVYTFFPEYEDKKWIDQGYPITLAHLMTMSAAIDWTDIGNQSGGAFESTAAMLRSGDWIGYVLGLDQTWNHDGLFDVAGFPTVPLY